MIGLLEELTISVTVICGNGRINPTRSEGVPA